MALHTLRWETPFWSNSDEHGSWVCMDCGNGVNPLGIVVTGEFPSTFRAVSGPLRTKDALHRRAKLNLNFPFSPPLYRILNYHEYLRYYKCPVHEVLKGTFLEMELPFDC